MAAYLDHHQWSSKRIQVGNALRRTEKSQSILKYFLFIEGREGFLMCGLRREIMILASGFPLRRAVNRQAILHGPHAVVRPVSPASAAAPQLSKRSNQQEIRRVQSSTLSCRWRCRDALSVRQYANPASPAAWMPTKQRSNREKVRIVRQTSWVDMQTQNESEAILSQRHFKKR
jgi:hypothetical protein